MDEAPWLNEFALEDGRLVIWRRAPQVVRTLEVWVCGGLTLVLGALGFAGQLWASVSAVLLGAWFVARAGLWVIGRRGLYEVTIDLASGAISLLDVRGLDAPRRAVIETEELASIELSEHGLAIWWAGDDEPAIRGQFQAETVAWAQLKAALMTCTPLAGKVAVTVGPIEGQL